MRGVFSPGQPMPQALGIVTQHLKPLGSSIPENSSAAESNTETGIPIGPDIPEPVPMARRAPASGPSSTFPKDPADSANWHVFVNTSTTQGIVHDLYGRGFPEPGAWVPVRLVFPSSAQ